MKRRETRFSKFDASNRNAPCYWCVLVSAPERGGAFVPGDDDGLRQALLSASGEPRDRETETLAAEIQRRELDC
ncbi:hypothetical protein ACMGDM_11960 [Sphingomonas sp. DT-51]|uniref:hypothetical protein n=1 Tax=Sphingomonas sp. DT-51 TaxID=3396165 RepID=UPI003F1C8440